jgi:hypothetical protein
MTLATRMSKSGSGRLILLSIGGLCLMALGGCFEHQAVNDSFLPLALRSVGSSLK